MPRELNVGRWRGVARALWVTAGHAALPRALALSGAMLVVFAIVFAPSGMRMHDVTHLAETQVTARVALWAVWVSLATPAIAPAFDAPGTRVLRATTSSRRGIVAGLLALALAAQAPWIALFGRGEGVLAAVGAGLLAAAIEMGAFAASRSRLARVCAVTATVLAIASLPPLVRALGGAPLAWMTARAAWSVALEQRPSMRIVRRAPPVIALASAYLARMVRVARARLHAAALVVAAGGGALALTLRNTPDVRPTQRALVVLALPLSLACGLLAAPATETEACLRPVLRAARTTAFTLACATALALGAPSSAFGASAGMLASITAPAPPSIALATAAWGLVIAVAVSVLARRTTARPPATFAAGVTIIAAVSTALAAAW